MRRAYLYRIYPDKKQATILDSFLFITRQLYNAALQERRGAWKGFQKTISRFEQSRDIKDLRKDIPELGLLNAQVCHEIIHRLDLAFQAFFRRIKRGEIPGFPRYKGKNRWDSITFPTYGNGIKITDTKLYIQNIGLVKVKFHRPIEGQIKTVCIRKSCDKWYASFSCIQDTKPLPATNQSIGIDMGLKHFAVTSEGQAIANPKYLMQSQKKLRVLQRSVSRKKLRSKCRRKAVKLLAKQHLKIKRQRLDFCHKVSKDLVNHYDHIAVEDLRINNMVKNHHLARSIQDASWGTFLNILSSKAEGAEREFIKVKASGTSQFCFKCGSKVPKTLSERTHNCPECGFTIDRDWNAALNIKKLGISFGGIKWQDIACLPPENLEVLANRIWN